MAENMTSDYVPQAMRTDIKEKEGQYLIEIELPGYKKENIEAQLDKGYLTIIAWRNEELENDNIKTNFIMKERLTGEIKRSFYVGDDVVHSDISAGLKDGILSVIIVKHEHMVERDDIKLITIN